MKKLGLVVLVSLLLTSGCASMPRIVPIWGGVIGGAGDLKGAAVAAALGEGPVIAEEYTKVFDVSVELFGQNVEISGHVSAGGNIGGADEPDVSVPE